jgi:hypothetical protein
MEIVEKNTTTNTTIFVNDIKIWVNLDKQLKMINEKTRNIREEKQKASERICKYLSENNKTKSKIKLNDGELKLYDKKEYSPLTFGFLEKCLKEIISDENQVDYIINFVKENREITTTLDLKINYLNK